MLGLAIAILMLWGLSAWTAIIVALLLVCPLIMIWGAIKVMCHPAELSLEPVPETRGMSLNWMAPFYDWLCLRFGLGVPFRKETLRYATLTSGELVLDVGCGTGVLTRMAAEAVGPSGKAIGIDPAPKMISLARKNAAFFSNSAEFRLAVIENLPFDNETFDAVLSSAMIHHLPPDLKHAGLLEVKRVLKPGGRLVVVDIDRPANPQWWIIVWPLLIMPTTREQLAGRLASYFTKAGFDPVNRVGRWMGILSFWLVCKPKKQEYQGNNKQ
jgi:ubiquinone/menaquinone biosynthesis C-methylase UbiE